MISALQSSEYRDDDFYISRLSKLPVVGSLGEALFTFIEPTKDADVVAAKDVLERAGCARWLNQAQRIMAVQRVEDSQRLRVPYVVLARNVGEEKILVDGAMAYEYFSRETNFSWSHQDSQESFKPSRSKDSFQAFCFEEKRWMKLGSYKALRKLGLNYVNRMQLLSASSRLPAEYLPGDVSDWALTLEKSAVDSKILYWGLLWSGKLGEDLKGIAGVMMEGVDRGFFAQRLLKSTALSSCHDQIVFKAVMASDFDVNRKCESLGCFPVSWSALHGNRQATKLLLERSPDAAKEYYFVRHYYGQSPDHPVVNWYLGQIGSRPVFMK